MITIDKYYKRVQEMSEERGDFIALEDGYVYFWPTRQLGALNSAELRIIADILDGKNRKWDAQVVKELTKLEEKHD